MAYTQTPWFTNPNHERASMILAAAGKFLMADNNLSDWFIPDGVMFSSANLTVS